MAYRVRREAPAEMLQEGFSPGINANVVTLDEVDIPSPSPLVCVGSYHFHLPCKFVRIGDCAFQQRLAYLYGPRSFQSYQILYL